MRLLNRWAGRRIETKKPDSQIDCSRQPDSRLNVLRIAYYVKRFLNALRTADYVSGALSKGPVAHTALLLAVTAILAACAGRPPSPPPPTPHPTDTPAPTATRLLSPTAPKPPVAREFPTLSPQEVLPYLSLQDMVSACDELHPNRRQTVVQHLDWLLMPDDIPAEFLRLYGQNTQGKLAFGAVYMVAVQWKLDGRNADSCLIPIGERLNTMTAAFGERPVPEFGFAAP